MKTLYVDKSEIRLNADGTVDEIVIEDSNGTVVFHLEQMSDQCFWMVLYPLDGSHNGAHVNIFNKNHRCFLTATLNEPGCGVMR